MKPKIIFLVGPTAIGKTDVACALAKKINPSTRLRINGERSRTINAEIISCDSMQIYRGMDIITSKPPAGLRKKVAHHLIDIIAPNREYNVSKYRRDALKKIKEILKKGKIPIFVGGTGLYMTILINGLFCLRSKNQAIRKRLYEQAEKLGNKYLYEKLSQIDPEAAARIHPNDIRRTVRALEVFETTGKPISILQKERKGIRDEYEVKIFCLNMPRGKLYKKIDQRVEKMFSQGVLAEVRKLLKLKLSKTASCAIGIKELKCYFEGQCNLEEAKQLMKRNSRLYAKRQLTWFRKDKRIKWVKIKEQEGPKDVARRLWKELCLTQP